MAELTDRDWERIVEGLELLRARELRKSRYGRVGEAFNRLFEKVAKARDENREEQNR